MSLVETLGFRSQYGEDRILSQEFSKNEAGYFVEVGSYNGESYSNTFFLEKSLHWKGVLIEADPVLHAQGASIRSQSINVNCAVVGPDSPAEVSFEVVDGCRWVSSLSVGRSMLKRIEDIPTQIRKLTVPARTLDSILQEAGAPNGFEFLSIDVEGHEWPVLQGFDLSQWAPEIIVLERNSHLPDRNIMRYMHDHGYGWKRTTGCNDWFYAGDAGTSAYRARVTCGYYAPKYLTLYRPVINGPFKRTTKRLLKRLGMLDRARVLLGKNRRRISFKLSQLRPRSPD